LAAQLVSLPVDLIVADTSTADHAAQHATTTIPIVTVTSTDPVPRGLVTSLARPGGNVTGVTLQAPELNGKRLQLLKEAVPGATSVVIFWNPQGIVHPQLLREAEVAAHALQLQLRPIGVRAPDDLEAAFGAAAQGRTDALITFPSGMLWNHRARVVQLAAGHRLPALYPEREFVDAGGLMSYGPSVPRNFRRAATYMDKILRGANPADLPVEQPTTFELVVHLKTAQALGLTIPPTLLFQADEVIR
jgi:putative tryptophan/tyrosine transport system substrate-binding protein